LIQVHYNSLLALSIYVLLFVHIKGGFDLALISFSSFTYSLVISESFQPYRILLS